MTMIYSLCDDADVEANTDDCYTPALRETITTVKIARVFVLRQCRGVRPDE